MSIIMPLRGKSTLSFTEITHNDMTACDTWHRLRCSGLLIHY